MIIVVTQTSDRFEDLLDEGENLMYTYPNLKLRFTTQSMDDDEDDDQPMEQQQPQEDNGTLYLTSKSMYWLGNDTKKGSKIAFVDIVMHAVENATNLYCQLDTDDDQDVSEMRLLSNQQDENLIQNLFKSFSEIALLNPCLKEGEEGGNDDFIFDCEEVRRNSLLHARDGDDEDGDTEEPFANKRTKTE
jgi:hypothetical protein